MGIAPLAETGDRQCAAFVGGLLNVFRVLVVDLRSVRRFWLLVFPCQTGGTSVGVRVTKESTEYTEEILDSAFRVFCGFRGSSITFRGCSPGNGCG
jgi:hypothetical protein